MEIGPRLTTVDPSQSPGSHPRHPWMAGPAATGVGLPLGLGLVANGAPRVSIDPHDPQPGLATIRIKV
jgi:hypothetical protein